MAKARTVQLPAATPCRSRDARSCDMDPDRGACGCGKRIGGQTQQQNGAAAVTVRQRAGAKLAGGKPKHEEGDRKADRAGRCRELLLNSEEGRGTNVDGKRRDRCQEPQHEGEAQRTGAEHTSAHLL